MKSKVDSFWDALDVFSKNRAAEVGKDFECEQCGGKVLLPDELDENGLCKMCRCIGRDHKDVER